MDTSEVCAFIDFLCLLSDSQPRLPRHVVQRRVGSFLDAREACDFIDYIWTPAMKPKAKAKPKANEPRKTISLNLKVPDEEADELEEYLMKPNEFKMK